ncbi:cytochrome P450 [Xylaria intraflava]|nr:cytochrome P450 [Xylaria intraflava]
MVETSSPLQVIIALLCILCVWSGLKLFIPPRGLPSAGRYRSPLLERIESLTKGKEILYRTYQEQLNNNQVYCLHSLFGDSIALLPSMLRWLISQPESILSAKLAQMGAFSFRATFLRPGIIENPIHETLIARKLTVHLLDRIEGDVWEEVGLALELLWGKDTQSWQEMNMVHTICRVIARATNRFVVGEELCRDEDYIENVIRYTSNIVTYGFLLNLFPSYLERAAGAILTTPIRAAYSQCSKHLIPLLSNLISNATPTEPYRFSSFLIANSAKFPLSSPERTPDIISRRLLAVGVASIHTTTATACSFLLDIFSQPTAYSLLYDEARTSGSQWNDVCNHQRLNQMPRLDSALRESMRLWAIQTRVLKRKVVPADGITLPNGRHIPQGATVCISGWGLHHDENQYPRPFEFVHDRYLRDSSEEESQSNAKPAMGASSPAAIEPDEYFSPWGIGKHACPGRFFAVDIIKMIVTRILLEYEVEPLETRPENVWLDYLIKPPPGATLRVRRRKAVLLSSTETAEK